MGLSSTLLTDLHGSDCRENMTKERDLDAAAALWVTVSKLTLTRSNYATFKCTWF